MDFAITLKFDFIYGQLQ